MLFQKIYSITDFFKHLGGLILPVEVLVGMPFQSLLSVCLVGFREGSVH